MKKLIVSFCLSISLAFAGGSCTGSFVNPITDVCWRCMLPFSIGNIEVFSGPAGTKDTPNPSMPLCACGTPIPRIGLSFGYWEPSSMTDITREPFCMVNMGFKIPIGLNSQAIGGVSSVEGNHTTSKSSFYWVHWYKFPLVSWLELLTNIACMEVGGFDLAYFSEVDPTWDDDSLSAILNPEAILFANKIAQLSCSVDAIKATKDLPIDEMFWCAGSQGSIYPLTGNIEYAFSSVSNAVLLTERTNFKLHRLGAILESSPSGICQPSYAPIMPKSRYRYQFTNPQAQSSMAYAYGASTMLGADAVVNKVNSGENFGILNFKKRNCCLL
jgi:conjugal transfer pilus assembly protein TraU